MPPMFISALFTRAKTWKQPKCPSTDEWINVCGTHTHTHTHTHTQWNTAQPYKEQNNAICSNMDITRDYHTTQSQKKTNTK